MNSTLITPNATIPADGKRPKLPPQQLVAAYREILTTKRFCWTMHHRMVRELGSGGQGVVYLSSRRGADGFTLPIAVKLFSPEHYEDTRGYDQAMMRIAHVAARVAQIQHPNLLSVQDFFDRNHIRMMAMEWVDGYDLRALLCNQRLARMESRVSQSRWEYLNRVILTQGKRQPMIKPGVAVAIVRDCLAALAALHREGIVHGDIKPANIMLKRIGTTKIIDIGSAFELADPPRQRTCTPRYAAPEILEGDMSSPRSDLASLGYVLIELLSGKPVFAGKKEFNELLEAKRFLAQRLDTILPTEVTCNRLLMRFICGLIAPDPTRRYPSAEAADFTQEGAAAFHRQLVKGDLASEYDNEIRLWMEEVKDLEDHEAGKASGGAGG